MNYPYANGIIKAQENSILDKAKLIRFTHDTPQAMMRELQEVGYGSPDATNLEDLITSELTKVKLALEAIAPEPALARLFFVGDDVINLKMLFKRKFFGYHQDLAYARNGAFKPEDLEAWVDHGVPLPDKGWNRNLASLLTLQAKGLTPRILSSRIDSLVIEQVIRSINSVTGKALKVYYEKKTTYINLLSLARARALGWPREEFQEMLVTGGEISQEKLLELYPLSDSALVQELIPFDFGKISQDLKQSFQKGDLGLLEIIFDNRLLSKMKEYHAEPFTIGPMLYYVLMKKAEATNIRTIASNPHFDSQHLLDY
ncbi:MAG: V-type ATPase subunit [Bacilli bacterium]|nr:V-type ATPase subunit [Bacilli bacterium]